MATQATQNAAQNVVQPVMIPGQVQTQSFDPNTAPAAQGSAAPQGQATSQQGTPPVPVHDPITAPENVVAMIEKARQDEKAKVYSTIEKLKQETKEKEQALANLQKTVDELKALTDKDLSADERMAKRVDALQQQIESERKAREAAELASQQRVHQAEMESYKHRRLAEVGANLIPEFVAGSSKEEIDASILVAQAEYTRLRTKIEQEVSARFQPQPGQVMNGQAGIPAVQSPYFTPPASGFPSQVNPLPVTESTVDMGSLMDLTSEEAVRSGRYEQVRQQLLQRLKGVSPTGQVPYMGSQPRHMNYPGSTPHVNVGGNVMQPQGYPTGPVVPTHMHHNAAVIPGAIVPGAVGGQLVNDPRMAAMDAINRTNAGQNPLVAQQQGKAPPGNLPAGGASAAQAAFNQRFQPTPPHSSGQG